MMARGIAAAYGGAMDLERPMAQLESELADKIEKLADRLHAAVLLALSAGDDLIEAKSRLSHGEWGPWLRDHFPLSERTAQDWMRLARNPQRLRISEAGSMREALAMLAPPREEPPSEPAEDDREMTDREFADWMAESISAARILFATSDLLRQMYRRLDERLALAKGTLEERASARLALDALRSQLDSEGAAFKHAHVLLSDAQRALDAISDIDPTLGDLMRPALANLDAILSGPPY